MKKIIRLTESDLTNLIKRVVNESEKDSKKVHLDEKKLKKLIEIISNEYPQINMGGCGVFAKAFHNLTGLPYMLIFDDGLPESDPPIHVMIKLPNNKFIDGEAIKTKKQIIKDYNDFGVNDDGESLEGELLFLEDRDGEILDNYYEELGSGLFSTCHKEDYEDIMNIIKNVLENS